MNIRSLVLAVLLLACSVVFPVCAAEVRTEEQAVKLATEAISRYQLTTLKGDCGVIQVTSMRKRFDLVVRERHTAACGGDSETEPRLFTLRVRKRDGQITSDVYDHVTYRLVDHMKGKAGE
jgi:hypothetical protein